MKVFLASFESMSAYICAMQEEKPYFILGSFFYLKKLKCDILTEYMTYVQKEAKDFILDSGAFSMLNSSKGDFLNILDKYIDDYIAFINKYDIKYFIELDIDKLIGYEKVKEIRSKLEKETNKKCIPVWHMSRGIEEFKKLCQEYSYIALGGIAVKDIKRKDYDRLFPPLLKIAKQYNCNVHGLGFTGSKINKFDFYSVDSSSWTGVHRFGQIQKYDHITNSMKNIKRDKRRIKVDEKIRYQLTLLTIKEWKKLQIMSLKK